MRQNEADTWYDANGRIVFTSSKGLIGVGLPRKVNKKDTHCEIYPPNGHTEFRLVGWEDIRDLPSGTRVIQTVTDDTLPGGPREKQITSIARFDHCNREDDYRIAWTAFSERFASNK